MLVAFDQVTRLLIRAWMGGDSDHYYHEIHIQCRNNTEWIEKVLYSKIRASSVWRKCHHYLLKLYFQILWAVYTTHGFIWQVLESWLFNNGDRVMDWTRLFGVNIIKQLVGLFFLIHPQNIFGVPKSGHRFYESLSTAYSFLSGDHCWPWKTARAAFGSSSFCWNSAKNPFTESSVFAWIWQSKSPQIRN